MSDRLCVLWTITSAAPPEPLHPCPRCNRVTPHAPRGRFRVNANGKRLDAWLLLDCTVCGTPWQRPVLRRSVVAALDPALLAGLRGQDPALAARLAEGLPAAAAPHIAKRVLRAAGGVPCELHIRCSLPAPLPLRLDRLLACVLPLPRARLPALAASGALTVSPARAQALRRPVLDRMELCLRLPAQEAAAIAAAAASD